MLDDLHNSYAYNWHEYFQSDLGLEISYTLTPYQKLALACLDRAIRDYKEKPTDNILNYYFFEENKPDREFSFLWCCQALNLKPNHTIKVITKYKVANED